MVGSISRPPTKQLMMKMERGRRKKNRKKREWSTWRENDWEMVFVLIDDGYNIKSKCRIYGLNRAHQPKILIDFPMEVLMWRVPMFCHPFFVRETKKLIPMVMFCLSCSSVCSTFPIAVPKQEAFLDWNLTVCLTSATLSTSFSPSAMAMGNFPSLTRTLPKSLVTCLATESDAKRTSYFFAHFLILVLSLLKALSPSTSMYGILLAVASSIWMALARTQTWVRLVVYSDFIESSVGESDGSIESLFGVVVTETDLKLNGFHKLSLFAFGDHLIDGFLHEISVDLRHCRM